MLLLQLVFMALSSHGIVQDAVVNLVGCFAESQLEKVRLKYYGDSNAANFAAMYWHAQNDHVQYFAMARHSVPLGHAFTAHGFLHQNEVPQWGVYDGCGSPCQDDDERWCGCANEAERGFPSAGCAEGEKRFAVYKIGVQLASEKHGETLYWKLAGEKEGEPSIEVVMPKGTKATANGNEVLVYNASREEGDSSKPSNEATSTSVAPISKVKLPVGVSTNSCENGWHVLRCKLEQEDVQDVPIKVIDEL
eukprot:g6297.t1